MGDRSHLRIRNMQPGDRDACARIFLSARRTAFHWATGDRFALDDFDRETAEEHVIVAVCDREIVGFVSVYTRDSYVHHLFVRPDRQRGGVGTALLDRALRLTGLPAELKCLTDNLPARAFYAKQGWREVDRGVDVLGEFVCYRKDRAPEPGAAARASKASRTRVEPY